MVPFTSCFACFFVAVTCFVANVCQGEMENSMTYVAPDGRLMYRTAYLCTTGTLYNVGNYAWLHRFYKRNADANCCYLVSSKRDCCFTIDRTNGMSSRTECQCSPYAQCEAPPRPPSTTTPTPTTPTPTTPTPTTTPTITPEMETTDAPTEPTTPMDLFYKVCKFVDDVEPCEFKNVAKLSVMTEGELEGETVCHAVYANVSINDSFTEAFLTTQYCTDIIKANSTSSTYVNLQFGTGNLKIDSTNFTLIDGPHGTAYIKPEDSVEAALQSIMSCQRVGCVYNTHAPAGEVDYGMCYVWAADPDYDDDTLVYDNLKEVDVVLDFHGCDDIPQQDWMGNSACFSPIYLWDFMSKVDSGAPVFCRSRHFNEQVLVGVVAYGVDKYNFPGYFRVIPTVLKLPLFFEGIGQRRRR